MHCIVVPILGNCFAGIEKQSVTLDSKR